MIADTGRVPPLLVLAARRPPRTRTRRIPLFLELLGRVPMPGLHLRHRTCRTLTLHRPLLDNRILSMLTDNMRLTLSTLTRS